MSPPVMLTPVKRVRPAVQEEILSDTYLFSLSQVRFELAWKACDPSLQVLAPWRIPEFYERFAS